MFKCKQNLRSNYIFVDIKCGGLHIERVAVQFGAWAGAGGVGVGVSGAFPRSFFPRMPKVP